MIRYPQMGMRKKVKDASGDLGEIREGRNEL